MKTGRSLTDIATELERQVKSRKDFIAPQGALATRVVEGEVVLDGLNGEPKVLTDYAHKQLADHLGIPTRYAERMRTEQPDLLARNINTWLAADPANQRMIRTLDERVRAVLSSKYRPLDNYDLAQVVLPELLKHDAEIASAELTATRMYIKAIVPQFSDTLPEGLEWGVGHNFIGQRNTRVYGGGGKVVAAITISNSEVGAGTLRIEPGVYTALCTNLAILMAASMKKYHVGRAHSAEEDFSVYRDETREQDDRAFWMKVRDITVAAFNEEAFKAAVAQIKGAAATPIESTDLPKVVEVTVKRLALPESTGNGILTALAKAGDLSKWGLSSAITEVANTVEDYEVATQLERAGGQVLALPDRDWTPISKAA